MAEIKKTPETAAAKETDEMAERADMENAWRHFVESYDIHVPEETVENEFRYITLEMRHRLQYDTLTNHTPHINARAELAARENEYRKLAYYEAKTELVTKKLLADWQPAVTHEELEKEASALAVRQNTTVDMVKRFFGEDLAMLERDIKERKVRERAVKFRG